MSPTLSANIGAVTPPSRFDIWSDHPFVDLIATAVLVSAHALATHNLSGWNRLAEMGASQRFIVYGALATVAALAAGSNNTAVASYSEGRGLAFDRIRQRHGTTLRTNFRSAGMWLWAAAALSLIALLIDGGSTSGSQQGSTNGSEWLFEVGFIIAAMKFVRLTFLQDLVLKANDLSPANGRKRSTRKWRGPQAPK